MWRWRVDVWDMRSPAVCRAVAVSTLPEAQSQHRHGTALCAKHHAWGFALRGLCGCSRGALATRCWAGPAARIRLTSPCRRAYPGAAGCLCATEGYLDRGSCSYGGLDLRISPRNACDWLAGVGSNANPRG